MRWGRSATTEPGHLRGGDGSKGIIKRWSHGNGKWVTAGAAGSIIRTSVCPKSRTWGTWRSHWGTVLDFCVEIGACENLQWFALEAGKRG